MEELIFTLFRFVSFVVGVKLFEEMQRNYPSCEENVAYSNIIVKGFQTIK